MQSRIIYCTDFQLENSSNTVSVILYTQFLTDRDSCSHIRIFMMFLLDDYKRIGSLTTDLFIGIKLIKASRMSNALASASPSPWNGVTTKISYS